MKKKFRIAILASYPIRVHFEAFSHIGGHESPWLVAFHDALKNSDTYEIHWIVLVKGLKKEQMLKDCGQFFHLIPRTKKTIGLCTMYIWDRYQINKCIKSIKPDLIHAWGTEDCYGLCAKDNNNKAILSIQGLLNALKKRAKIARFERIQSFYEPSVLKHIPFITTESPWAKERILEIDPNAHVTLFEYAVEQRFFSAKRDLELSPNCLIACSNAPVKNVSMAINAFSDERLRHIKLYIAGVRKDRFKNLPKNIIMLGAVNRDKIVALLSKTWALVHPSLADTGPTIAKEARVMRVPVIISSDCGAKQYVQHEKSGFIYSPHDKEALINAILKTTKDAETSIAMGLYDSERCRIELSEDTMIRNIDQIYRSILTMK